VIDELVRIEKQEEDLESLVKRILTETIRRELMQKD